MESLGRFSLGFERGGKLLGLSHEALGGLLNQADYRFDCGDGRVFVPAGWDECFPTIEPFDASPVMGDLIGVEPCIQRDRHSVRQTWTFPRYDVERVFSGSGTDRMKVEFTVRNRTAVPIPFLWASHALFSVEGLSRVELPDGTSLDQFARDGPCRKWFVQNRAPVIMHRDSGRVSIRSDQPYWGLWLNRGGWPASGHAGVACLGVEATTTAGEIPAGRHLAPGESFTGQVEVDVELTR